MTVSTRRRVIRGSMLVSNRLSILSQFMGVIGVILALVSSEVQAGTSPRAALEAKAATCPELPNVTWWKTTRVQIQR